MARPSEAAPAQPRAFFPHGIRFPNHRHIFGQSFNPVTLRAQHFTVVQIIAAPELGHLVVIVFWPSLPKWLMTAIAELATKFILVAALPRFDFGLLGKLKSHRHPNISATVVHYRAYLPIRASARRAGGIFPSRILSRHPVCFPYR